MHNQNREGQRVPNVRFRVLKGDRWTQVTSDELFNGKTVVLFALPGAFTPTCSSAHLPRYRDLAAEFRRAGVDSVICLSVNDPYVMAVWATDQGADDLLFIPDGNGEFTEGMGMLVDRGEQGLGKRSWRYSMLVKDGVIEKMFIERDDPDDPFEVSDADTMLDYINPKAKKPRRVTLFTKPGCPHCARAKKALSQAGYPYEEIVLGKCGVTYSSLQAVAGRGTTPQVFIDGQLIGSADQLQEWLAQRE